MIEPYSLWSIGSFHRVMNFSTQKVGNIIKKSIFRALECRVWLFGSAQSSSKYFNSKTERKTEKHTVHVKYRYPSVFATVFVIISVLAITSRVESSYDFVRQLDTLNVLPGEVVSDSWRSPTHALSQDVTKDGVYQSFSRANSAYLSNEFDNTEDINTHVNTDFESVGSDTGSGVDVLDTTESEYIQSTESTPNDADETQTDPDTQEGGEETSNPEPVEQEVSLQNVGAQFFGVSLHDFAQTVHAQETLEGNSVSDTSETEVQTVPEVLEIPIEEGTAIVETETELIDTDTIQDETTAEVSEVRGDTPSHTQLANDMEFHDFALPKLNSGQFITNVELMLSLGGQVESVEGELFPSIELEYTFGGEWVSAGTVLLDGEVSNAMNGGYYRFVLPQFKGVTELGAFNARLSYHGSLKGLKTVYVDSLWLQVETETFDRTVLNERILPGELTHLTLPTLYEFLSTDIDFTRGEVPRFSLKYESQRNPAIRFLRSLFGRDLVEVKEVVLSHVSGERITVHPQIDVTADGLITIQLTNEDLALLSPGEYAVELVVDEGGKIFTDTFEFQWGVLAVNTDQTEYALGATTTIMLGAVNEGGNTLCDADLRVYIIDPSEYISEAYVTQSGMCNGNNFTDVPDYTAEFQGSLPGTYELYVERLGEHGEVLGHTNDTFLVKEQKSLTLSRKGPTRINPEYVYPMTLTLSSTDGFSGEVVEYVPDSFTVSDTDATIINKDGMHELHFDVSLSAGENASYSYSFDAPDVSPFLYSLGPAHATDDAQLVTVWENVPQATALVQETIDTPIAESDIHNEIFTEETNSIEESAPQEAPIESSANTEETISSDTESVPEELHTNSEESGISTVPTGTETTIDTASSTNAVTTPQENVGAQNSVFAEHRRWQIASDATGSMIVLWTDGATIPSGWTCISCVSTSTFYQRFPKGGASYGTTGGASTTTHTADMTVNATTSASSENNAGTAVSISTHSHATATIAVVATSTLPAYRQLRVIQNNSAGVPSSIPAGAILIFDGTLPSGWTRYSALDDRYPYGQNTIANGGSNLHRHTMNGTTSPASGSTYNNRAGGTQASPRPATASHYHTVSTSSIPTNHEPPYIEVVFATSSVATSTPLNAIAMWSDTPPAGWLDRSSSSDKPFYNRYIKGASSYGTTGGADTHTHSTMSATTSGSSAAVASARTGSSGVPSTHYHGVDISNFSNASNTPPYVSVIFAKFYGYVPIYDQAVFKWFVNTDSDIPTDAWPVGEDGVDENQAIDSTYEPLKSGDVVRLRIGLDVANSTTTGESFKLQFGTTSSACTAVAFWTDVGSPTSSEKWIGYDNGSVNDGATLSSSTLTGTDRFESYEESNPSITLPNTISVGERGEWDFVLKQNNAEAGTNYCFRMVEDDGTTLFSYTQYPMLVTNIAPNSPTLIKLFDNEKVASTTPWFEFTATDAESNGLSYEIQIDDDYSFGSVNIENDTVSDPGQFENLTTPADKDPYTAGETIRFIPPSALTNGITYYWRVRAQDTTGSNAWSAWSAIYSFTIDNSVTVSTWFQTIEEQFDTDTLQGTDALVSDVVQLASGSTTGTTTSTAIDFEDGSIGNAWGSLAFIDTETSSDLKYRLQYYDDTTSSWLFIPTTALAGNDVGFDTSPQSLLSIDTSTYRIIRLVAVFTNSGASPTLSDWTLSWGYRIETPTLNAPFPNEKVGTTTPTFEFLTTDPQGDSLVYEVQWSESYNFTASTTRVSSTSPGFVNASNGGDTTPFNSGDTIQFTIQPSDVLTNGHTYWWRVRAIDPYGSQQYSFYTDPQSFTVDASVTVSTWYQTTVEQFNTDITSGVAMVSTTSATVATTSLESLIAYAEGSVVTPRYRVWNGTLWSNEGDALPVGAAPSWTVTRASPTQNEYILGTLGSDADVNVQVYRNGTWDNLQEVTTNISNTSMRGFDVSYETISGDALVVTCDGDADPTYYTWDGTSWTLGGTVNLNAGNACGWVKLISNPTSNEIIVVTRDVSGTAYEALVWNGTAWGTNRKILGSMQSTQTTHEGIAAAYEDSGNQAVIVVSNGTTANGMVWTAWGSATWTVPVAYGLGDDFEAGTLASDDGTDNMALCYIDQDRDIGVTRWNGTNGWTGQVEQYTVWDVTSVIYDDRPVDCIYETNGARNGYLTMAYATTTGVAYQSWNGTAWSTASRVSTLGPTPRIQARRTDAGIVQIASYASTTDRYDYTYWDGSSWSTLQTLETDGSSGASPFKEPLMIAPKNPGITATIVGDPAIDFYDGSGPYWQQMSWNDTEAGGSTILYQVEYYDGDSWELVPDSAISGNSTGIGTSPINLTGLLPVSQYHLIRPVANFTCNAGTCPVLSDWTITWSAGITISGIAQQFNQSSNVTSGTVNVAVNGVLQTGKTGTISGGTWSIANVNVAPGDIVTVFVSGANDENEAIAVARYDGVGDMTGLRLYEQHVALGSDDATTTPFTNAQIGVYDYTQDEDLFFDVAGSSLTLCAEAGCANSELYIRASTTYTPTGFSNLTSIENNGTFTMGTSTIYVSRSWDNNGTTTSGTSQVYFTATSTTETIDETGALTPSFYTLTFGTTTGNATWNLLTPLDINNTLTVERGTLARGAVALTIGGSLQNLANGFWTGNGTTTFDGSGTSNWSDANSTLQNVGRVVIDGSSKTVQLTGNVKAHSITIGGDDILDASTGNYDITVLSDFINYNTFVARAGEVIMSATTTNRTITAGGDAFYDLTMNGAGGAWSFTESNLTINNDFRVSTGTVTLPSATTTLLGSWNSVGGTFAHNNSAVLFTSTGAETISASGTPFTNNFYTVNFNGSGSWTFLDTYATTSNDFIIQQGTVTLPNANLSIGGSYQQSGGVMNHNSGTVSFTSASTETVDVGASSFNSLSFTGSGSRSFLDSNVIALGSVWVTGGTLTLPSGTFTIGGSYGNYATVTHNSGTVLFNSTDVGETIVFGSSPLNTVTFNGATGGWSIQSSGTTTSAFTLTSASQFALGSGYTLAVGGQFVNSVGGASTTWTGSTLSLEAGNYSVNAKTNTGDDYEILRVKANTDIKMWNSRATTTMVDTTGSLYSQDHANVDGNLYLYGAYERTSGTEYWSNTVDFDGTAFATSSYRQALVKFADGASALIQNATLTVTGSSTASTTISNQGSGTYTVAVTSGTTTASYYDFRDLGTSGLSLLGGTKVTSLSHGRFVPSITAGTGITVSTTTIDANQGLQIYTVDFSTTTAISATNVTQIGGAPTSYWWFRESAGNIDGEYFDSDTGDPGSIRWDDSSLTITISGTVYSDDGTTFMSSPVCDGSTQNIRVVVEGGATYNGSCAVGNGTFSIGGIVIVGDPVVTVFLNTNGGAKGAVVTRTPTGDLTNFNIYQNRVITRHENTSPLTILNMAVYDYDNDTDIPFTAATGTLSLMSDTELHIASSTTFDPQGDITIAGNASSTSFDGSLHIDDYATFIGSGTSTYTIAGSFTMDQGATFTPASTTVVMNATTTGKTITTTSSQEIQFNTLTFTGAGGGWNINGDIRAQGNIAVNAGTISGTADITLANGSFYGNGLVSLGMGTTTIEKTNTLGGITPWTFGNLVLGSGSVVGTTTLASNATTTILGKLTISTAHFMSAGGSVINLAGTGNVFVENGTFLEATSTVRYSGTASTSVVGTTYYNLEAKAQGGAPTYTATGLGIIVTNGLTVGGPNTTTFNFDTSDPVLDVNGNFTIETNGTFVGSGNASTTVAGNWDNDGVFTHSGGTITFDGNGTSNIYAGSSWFANVRVNGAGTYVVAEHATATSAFTLANAGAFVVSSGQSLAVGGTFANNVSGAVTDWTGSTLYLYGGGNYTINSTSTSDTYNVLRIASGTQIRMWNSGALTYDVHSAGSLYSQDHVGVDGDLYIYGSYTKTSGTDYWNYAQDFDGSTLGSPRTADVYIANGGSILYTGGGLSVLGVSTGSTTIQNQGSGSYAFRIGGTASTTWSYYKVRNTDTSGVVFSGTPTVNTLSYGDFEVSQNNGTAITVGGTAIQVKTFVNNAFGASGGVSPAYNVTATGTTINTWRFTAHSGSVAGEAYDSDPGPNSGDPGYIVWDNSSTSKSVSGNVYSGEGSGVSGACDGSTDIHLVVAGTVHYTTTCDGGTGAYTFTGVTFSLGDAYVVYIDGKSEKAATVGEDAVSSISNFDLYENRVIVRHEGTDPLSIADMSLYDSSDDGDIPFTASLGAPNTLTLPANRKLIVWTGKEFEPNGNVTVSGGGGGSAYDGTLELFTNAIFDATGSETHTIGGSLIMGAGATLDDEQSTFIFTTTGSARTVDTNEETLYNATFNGSGSWTVTNTAFILGNDLTITQGAVTLPSGTTTISGSLSVTSGSFNANGGTMLFNSSGAETISAGGSNFNALSINGAGSFVLQGTNATATADMLIENGSFTSVSGTFAIVGDFINDGTFAHNSGTLRMLATTSAVLTASSSDLQHVTFAGSGPFTMTDTSVAILGALRVDAGSVTLPLGTTAIGGSLIATGGTFSHASGTILFNSSDVGETITPGTSTFSNVVFGSATGGWTITGNATTTGNFSLVTASGFTQASSTRLTVGGLFTNAVGGGATTWTGSTLAIRSGVGYTVNTKTTGGDVYNTILVGSSTSLRLWDSAGTITMEDSVSSLYSQDHGGTSGVLNIYGNYVRASGIDYWSYLTDFDGASLSGSPRQVYVNFAEGASSTQTGGTLNIIGANGFDTTISNQGVGTYGLNVYGGTINAQYYSISNIGASGLVLGGATTTVTSLTEGNFTLAVSGGSLITLSSTTLNYNAGLVITGNSFATTTAITGYNVKLVGTTPSAWTFVGHTGNFDGENFDYDGADDCSSIRWDDSVCLLTEQVGYRWRNDDGGEGVPNTEWYDTNWTKRMRVSVTNYDAVSYTNATVKVIVPKDGDMQTDFDDLRFTASDGLTPLSHYIETYTGGASGQAIVWVKVPTLATSTITTLYMYYGNGAVGDGSVATSTFAFADTFEDGNISEYSGDTSLFNVNSGTAYEHTYGVDAQGNEGAKATDGIYRNDITVSQGQTLRYFQYIDTSAGSGDETCTLFGVQSPGSNNQNYAVCLELFGTDRVTLARDVDYNDASGVILASSTITYTTGWHEVEIDWKTNNGISVRVSRSGSVVASLSTTNSTYTSGGVGFTFWFQNGGWDMYTARPYIATAPTTTLGAEQVPNGASWKSALNTKAIGVNIGDVMRPRFVIENTGLSVTDAYQIEYAPKGASPSCESVGGASYIPVPVSASCGSSPICMASSYLTQGDPTTDVLGGTGTFVSGATIENATNTTGAITLQGGNYTEVEYAITPTANVTESNYCFRVTDNGTDIDSYARVAEMELIFVPNITSLNFNGGLDINLLPGTTTRIYATGTVTDLNGWNDLGAATSTFYQNGPVGGVGYSCTSDSNTCYRMTTTGGQCSYNNCAGDSCDITCFADIYFYANPTDAGTFAGDAWTAYLEVTDLGGSVATNTSASLELTTLLALSVGTTIDYPQLEANADSGSVNASTTVENIGNKALDVAIEGTDLTDGSSSYIPAIYQKFATTTFSYSGCGTACKQLSSTTPTNFEVDLAKPVTSSPPVIDDIYWGIAIPFGVAGTPHYGANTFYAVND